METIKMLAVPFAIIATSELVIYWLKWGKFMIESLKQK